MNTYEITFEETNQIDQTSQRIYTIKAQNSRLALIGLWNDISQKRDLDPYPIEPNIEINLEKDIPEGFDEHAPPVEYPGRYGEVSFKVNGEEVKKGLDYVAEFLRVDNPAHIPLLENYDPQMSRHVRQTNQTNEKQQRVMSKADEVKSVAFQLLTIYASQNKSSDFKGALEDFEENKEDEIVKKSYRVARKFVEIGDSFLEDLTSTPSDASPEQPYFKNK